MNRLAALGIAVLLLAACAAPEHSIVPVQTPVALQPPVGLYTTADRVTLPYTRQASQTPRKAIVLALHGFNDHSRFIAETANYLARHGVETIAYDQRGFGAASDRGRWSGADAMATDFLTILNEIQREHPAVPIYVLGESMGAGVIAIALSRAPQTEVAGVLLVTPAVWSRDSMPWYQRFAIWFGARMAPESTISSGKFNIPASDNPAVPIDMANDPLVFKVTPLARLAGLTDLMGLAQHAVPRLRQRTLLLYGLQDAMMPRRPLITLFARWPTTSAENYRYALYPNGHHLLLRDLQRKVVWDDIVSWIFSADARLPSGFERRQSEVLGILRATP